MSALSQRLPFRSPRSVSEPLIPEARARQHRRRIRVTVVLIAAACAAGLAVGISRSVAGGHPAALGLAPAATVPNPCTLLTKDEAAAALGIRIESSTTQLPPSMNTPPGTGFRMCTWTGARFANSGYENNIVTLQVIPMSRAHFEDGARVTKPKALIGGLGDSAYATTGPYYSVNVLSHGLSITVNVEPSSSLRIEERLARLAVARLR